MKQKTVFACQECGAQSSKWLGRCAECGAWNSLVEERPLPEAAAAVSAERRYSLASRTGPQLYEDIDTVVSTRLTTGIDEFDRVLGGGVVPGSLVLIGGEPGIGKSTLLLQAAAHFAHEVGTVLYCSGEESEHQIKSRGERLGVERAPLYILAETCLERILEEIARLKPAFIIVDSIQTVFSLKFQSAPGSIGQVRESATQLLFAAKGQNIPTFLVGHVTKDGNIAGPKALGNARRMASGIDQNRLSLLLAVLEKRAGLNLMGEDVFVNIAGGMSVEEPAADLGILAAVASSVRNRAIKQGTVVFGEVGLAGEVRGVNQAALRVREAAQMGFARCVVAQGNCPPEDVPEGIELVTVKTVGEALDATMDW